MAQIQGIKIAATMIALVLGLTTVNTLAAASGIAIQMNANGITTEDIDQTVSNASSVPASGVGERDPGFFGIATGMTQTFAQVFALTTNLTAILSSFGVPSVIGASAQIMVDFTVMLALYQIIRAVRF